MKKYKVIMQGGYAPYNLFFSNYSDLKNFLRSAKKNEPYFRIIKLKKGGGEND